MAKLVDVHFVQAHDNGQETVVGYGGDDEKKIHGAAYKFDKEGNAKVPDYVWEEWEREGLAIALTKPSTKKDD